MTLAIIKQQKLRTGDVDFSSTKATSTDEYIVTANDHATKEEIATLFIAYTPSGGPPNPIPQGTLKQLGSAYLICDRISVTSEKAQFYKWRVVVTWKETEDSDPPQNQSNPMPNSASTNPDDWTPSWSRRSQIIHEQAFDGFYKGGFPDPSRGHTYQTSFGSNRAPIKNSAGDPFDTSGLNKRRRVYLWNFRWLRAAIPASLMDAEGKANSEEFTLVRNSYAFTFDPHTAVIESVDVSKFRWGNVNLVEISVEIYHDPAGLSWKIRDQGFNRRAEVGDKDNSDRTISGTMATFKTRTQQIVDRDGKPVSEAADLNGDGQLLAIAEGEEPVYPEWSDFEEVDFNSVALVSAL